ncbi:MAG: DUF2799 domain-containing protein [Rhizobiaceae bacterium]
MACVPGYVLRAGVLGAALIALGSCATLNEDQCREVSWEQLGYDDGQAGRHSSHVDLHRQACQRYNISVNTSEWREGWESGIRQYCTPQNGLNEGRAGRSYANSCPADVRADFEDAYRVAKAVHDARNAVDRQNRELDDLMRKLREEEDRDEMRKLQTEISVKRDAVRSAERRLRDAERNYDFYVYETGVRG